MFDSDKEIGESLDPDKKAGSKLKLILIIVGCVILIAAIIVLIVFLTKKDKDHKDNISANLTTIPLPEDIIIDDGHYLFDGNIFICYKRSTTNFTYFGVISDEGKNFKELYGAKFDVSDKANGIRLIPFRDNKRVYLGDFIFECSDSTKTLSSCDKNKGVLIPVIYPEKVINNTFTYMIWSEMVVAPDMIHVAWTSLNMACGAVDFLGKFEREADSYKIVDSKLISNIKFLEKDKTNETILIPQVPRGGEIKQFVAGGNGLTLVGTQPDEFVKSVFQSLTTNETYTLSHEIGYDETSILSPDEKLGIAMSTRFSPKTSMGILGLMPRPYCSFVLSKIIESVYTYAVTNVRQYRKGNVGPVLFEKEKSMKDPNYHGIDLHDKEDKYVFNSPISWHPNNLKAIWPETLRGTKNRRLRKLEISNYTPSEYPKLENTTDNVPYALDMSEMDKISYETKTNGIIKGKNSGHIEYYNSGVTVNGQNVTMTYVNFSNDGKKIYNGVEEFIGKREGKNAKNVYRSTVVLSGSENGTNSFTLTFKVVDGKSDLIKEETSGSATYGGKTINAQDYEA